MYSSEINQQLLVKDTGLFQMLSGIQKVAQSRNSALGVNGVLVVDNGRFVQILEGEHSAVEQLFVSISGDPRHLNFQILIDQPVRSASFSAWNMDVFVFDDKHSMPAQELRNFIDSYLRNEKPNGRELGAWVKRLMTRPEIRFSGTK